MRSIASTTAAVRSSGPAGPSPTMTTVPTGPCLAAGRCRRRRERRCCGGRRARRRLGRVDLGDGLVLVEGAELRVHLHLGLLEGVGEEVLQLLAAALTHGLLHLRL